MSSEIPPVRTPPSRPGPAGGARDTNRRQKVEALRQAALALFLERGIEATTIDDITRAARMAKGSYYRYFADKTALVESIIAPLRAAVEQAFATGGAAVDRARGRDELVAAYELLSAEVASVIFSRLDEVRLYLQESRGPQGGARAPVQALAGVVARHAVEMTERARVRGLLRTLPGSVSALAVVGAVERLLVAVLAGEEQGSPLEVAQALVSLVLDGVRA